MIDRQLLEHIKNKVDLISLLGKDIILKRVAATDGGEWAGPCPSCGGHDRFRVWPNSPRGPHFWCREGNGGSGCDFKGDCFTYTMRVEKLTFAQAVQFCADFAGLNIKVGEEYHSYRPRFAGRLPRGTPVEIPLTPPNPVWQQQGRTLTTESQYLLWTPGGKPALDHLFKRGLTEETIKNAGLGFIPRRRQESLEKWGLFQDANNKTFYIPQGIVIPWIVDNRLWRVEIRFLEPQIIRGKMLKGLSLRGSTQYLYGADALRPDKPAMLVEAVFDYLSVIQCADDLITPVATGGISHARRKSIIKLLSLSPLTLVGFDNDGNDGLNGQPATKGNGAAQWWIQNLYNAKRWRPTRKDINDMLMAGVNVRGWIEAALVKYYHPQLTKREVFYL